MRIRALCTLLHSSPSPPPRKHLRRVPGSEPPEFSKYVLTSVLSRSFFLTAESGSTTLSALKNTGASMLHILWMDLEF
jgi:hypothetical protein